MTEGPTEDNPRNVSPSGIVGLQDNKITNVSIENVEIVYPGGGNPLYAKVGLDELDKVPEMPKAYPEFSQHKELPAWGFLCPPCRWGHFQECEADCFEERLSSGYRLGRCAQRGIYKDQSG